jgi:hypothetical protein
MTLAVDFYPLAEGYCFTSDTPLTLTHTCPLLPHPHSPPPTSPSAAKSLLPKSVRRNSYFPNLDTPSIYFYLLFLLKYDEKEGGVYWSHNPNTPPFTCHIEDPAKGSKLGGLKSFMEYKIHAQVKL